VQIKFSSIKVKDQDVALRFYTEILGFQKMADIAMGPYRWLTVVSPDGVEGAELVLEPLAFPPALVYQQALFDAGIPALGLISQDIAAEVARLKDKGVVFRGEPVHMGPIIAVLLEDGSGNLINLVQPLM
jgi:catechol 2,3-dioxygenase-like lactoylglutathione lyase family enzyme